MYRIYADDILIYNDIATEEAARLVSPTLEWSDNATGSLTFTIPAVNAGYSELTLMKSKIKVYRNDDLIWVGRPIKETKDFWKNRQITCEGALGYLNDVIQPQRELPGDDYPDFQGYPEQFLDIVLSYHNQVMHQNGLDDRRIFMGQVTVTDMMKNEDSDDEYYQAEGSGNVDTYIPTIYTDHKNTLELISEKLTSGKNVKGDDLEGHLRLRIETDGFYLDYLKDPIESAEQEIEFGKNLLDFTVNYDESDFCTVLLPQGASDGESYGSMSAHIEIMPEQNGWKSKDDLKFYVDAPRVYYKNPSGQEAVGLDIFGYIEKVVDFSDITDEDVLLDKAMEWFTKNRFNDMEIDIKAFDLAYMGVNYEFLKYMDSVHVRSVPHGLDKDFPVLGISIPLDQPQNASYTLGKKKVQSLSAHSSQVSKEVTHTTDYVIPEAERRSETLIRNATTGVINVLQNQYGAENMVIVGPYEGETDASYQEMIKKIHNKELKVEDIADRPMWVWNMGGLGYFPNGLHQDSNVAIDMQGRINADFIKAGKIRAIDIEGTNITSGSLTTGLNNELPISTYVGTGTVSFRHHPTASSVVTKAMLAIGLNEYNQANVFAISAWNNCDIDMTASSGNVQIMGRNIMLNSFYDNGRAVYLSLDMTDGNRVLKKSEIQSLINSAVSSITGDWATEDYVDDAVSDSADEVINYLQRWAENKFEPK